MGTLLNVSLFYDIKLSGMSDLEVTYLAVYATCVQVVYYNCSLVPYVSTLVAYSMLLEYLQYFEILFNFRGMLGRENSFKWINDKSCRR